MQVFLFLMFAQVHYFCISGLAFTLSQFLCLRFCNHWNLAYFLSSTTRERTCVIPSFILLDMKTLSLNQKLQGTHINTHGCDDTMP